MATLRLYFADPLLVQFEAEVIARSESGLVLDRSAFYPEGGGQMSDHGEIAGLTVLDVQVDDVGVVTHTVSGDLPPIGARVLGMVDRSRRRSHMALHTGQHILSRALVDVLGAETVSSRLGENLCTIDVSVAGLDDAGLARAEDLANSIVDDDVEVRAFFPEPGELEALPLRRRPKVTTEVRVVKIGEFDVTPCGGTHCIRSSQVGSVFITSSERYKGGTRVSFVSGPRARTELGGQAELLRELGRGLTCGPNDVPAAIEKLRRDLQTTREELGKARARAAETAAEDSIRAARARGETLVVAVLEGADAELVRSVAARISGDSDLVAVVAGPGPEGVHTVVARGTESTVDCRELFKKLAASSGGRGGGRVERAEGRLPPGTDVKSLVQSVGS